VLSRSRIWRALDASKDDWTWMQRYRLWQADREIFLWPENWLVARRGQSPVFRARVRCLLSLRGEEAQQQSGRGSRHRMETLTLQI
jgi:hypothetical protein